MFPPIIPLTSLDGDPTYVNMDRVAYMIPRNCNCTQKERDFGADFGSSIYFSTMGHDDDMTYIDVAESLDEILDKIESTVRNGHSFVAKATAKKGA